MSDLVFKPLPYTDPVVQRLLEEIYADQVFRYGGPDSTVVDAAEFVPPSGVFLTAWRAGEPVGCAAWRTHGADAELKRMYTVPSARNQGIAIALLTEIENNARAAGKRRLILETGDMQPEAIALYEKCGYQRVDPFGYYRDFASARHYGRVL